MGTCNERGAINIIKIFIIIIIILIRMAVASDGKTEAQANVSEGEYFSQKKKKKSWKTCRHLNTIGEEEESEAFLPVRWWEWVHMSALF